VSPINSVSSRRGFIVGGAAAVGAAVAVAGGLQWLEGTDRDYAHLALGRVPEFLTLRQLGVLTVAAATIIERAAGAPSADDAYVARRIDREMVFANRRLGEDVRASLDYLEVAPLLKLMPTKFTTLGAPDRAHLLGALQTSNSAMERSIFSGVRFLCMFMYYADDRTWRSVGYAGPFVPEKLFPAGNRIANLSATATP